jgi:hypothetical protein
MTSRPRLKGADSLKNQLALYAKVARELASRLPPGPERDELTERAEWADTSAAHCPRRPRRIHPCVFRCFPVSNTR